MANIIHKDLSYILNGILFEVHNEIGRFASEKQICDAIQNKLEINRIEFKREFTLPTVNGDCIGRHRLDFLVENKIVLEIKIRKYLIKEDYAQVQRYLKELNLALGILVNFRDLRLNVKRILNGGGKE